MLLVGGTPDFAFGVLSGVENGNRRIPVQMTEAHPGYKHHPLVEKYVEGTTYSHIIIRKAQVVYGVNEYLSKQTSVQRHYVAHQFNKYIPMLQEGGDICINLPSFEN